MNADLFQRDMRKAINKAISRLDSGTVGIGEDCLWQLTVGHIDKTNGPTGTNAAWVARETFNAIVRRPPFSTFVYHQ